MALRVSRHQGERERWKSMHQPFLLVWRWYHLLDTWDEDGPFGINELGQEQDQIGHRLVYCTAVHARMKIAGGA